MSLPIVLRREAQVEFDDAIDWYEQRQTGLGTRFDAAIHAVFTRIAANPLIHGVVDLDIRKAVVRGFPYCVYYVAEPACVLILSVFHTSRDPAIWKGRRNAP